MNIGIIGLPRSETHSLLNVLTKSPAEAGNPLRTIEISAEENKVMAIYIFLVFLCLFFLDPFSSPQTNN
jgi:hypothetical protein